MTNSTSNVHLDGNGHLDITALGSGSNWTSGRIQTTSANVGAPAGGELEVTASIQQPNPGNGLGYWPAFWMLGPGQWPENGEIDIMEDVNALSEVAGTVHCGVDPGGPCNETQRHRQRPAGLLRLPDRLPHVLDDPEPHQHRGRVDHLLPRRRTSTSRCPRARSAPRTWQAAFDHNLSIIFDLAMGGGFPNGVCGCTSPSSSTTSGGTMSVQYVAAYTTSGGRWRHHRRRRRRPAAAPARSPATAACASTTAPRAPPTSTRCRSTPATAPPPSSGRWSRRAARCTSSGKCLDINGGGTADGTHGGPVRLQQHRRAGVHPAVQRLSCTTRSPTSVWTTPAGRPRRARRCRSGTAPAAPTSSGPCRNDRAR